MLCNLSLFTFFGRSNSVCIKKTLGSLPTISFEFLLRRNCLNTNMSLYEDLHRKFIFKLKKILFDIPIKKCDNIIEVI